MPTVSMPIRLKQMLNHTSHASLLIAVLGLSSIAFSVQAQESPDFTPNAIVVNQETGEWIFKYTDIYTHQYAKQKYTPPNLIEPTMQSAVKWTGTEFAYFYALRNSKKSQQEIVSMYVNNLPVSLAFRSEPERPSFKVMKSGFAEDLIIRRAFEADYQNWVQEQQSFAEKRMEYSFQWQPSMKVTSRQMTYGWHAAAETQGAPTGVKPGEYRRKMRFALPNLLPGVAMAVLKGRTATPPLAIDAVRGMPTGMPSDDNIYREKVLALLATSNKEIPVMVPLLTIPKPYNSVTLAYALKDHVQTWVNLGLIDSTVLTELNTRFYTLTTALQTKDKETVRKACQLMLHTIFKYAPADLDHTQFGTDDDDLKYEATPLATFVPAKDGSLTQVLAESAKVPMHRVAARVLGYDVMYLLQQSEAYVKPKAEAD